jgi:hypothetical protein
MWVAKKNTFCGPGIKFARTGWMWTQNIDIQKPLNGNNLVPYEKGFQMVFSL